MFQLTREGQFSGVSVHPQGLAIWAEPLLYSGRRETTEKKLMEASTAEPFTLGNIWNTSKVTVGTRAQVDTCAGPSESNWQVLARPALHVADKESEAQRGPGLPKDTPLIINTHVLIPVSSLIHGGAHPNHHPATRPGPRQSGRSSSPFPSLQESLLKNGLQSLPETQGREPQQARGRRTRREVTGTSSDCLVGLGHRALTRLSSDPPYLRSVSSSCEV